ERQLINSRNIQDMRDVVGRKRYIKVAVVGVAITSLSRYALAVAASNISRTPHRPAHGGRRSRVADDAGQVRGLDVLLEGVCSHKRQPLRIALLKPGLERVVPVETVRSDIGSESTILGIRLADYT